jgi:hypothetical protein
MPGITSNKIPTAAEVDAMTDRERKNLEDWLRRLASETQRLKLQKSRADGTYQLVTDGFGDATVVRANLGLHDVAKALIDPMERGWSLGYAIGLYSPAGHVGILLADAAPTALSVDELAEGYDYALSADLRRVRYHELDGTRRDSLHDPEAERWVIEHVAKLMAPQVIEVDGKYRLADGVTLDDLRVGAGGSKIERPAERPETPREAALRKHFTGEPADAGPWPWPGDD